ncbi:MAG: porin [Armatimonadota bacterium]
MKDSLVRGHWRRLVTVSVIVVGVLVTLSLTSGPAAAGPGAAEKAYVDAYIKGLVEIGVITQQQADQLRAKAEAAATEAAKVTPAPKKAWSDTTKVGGYLQFRWNDHPDKASSLGKPDNDFQVRRARIKVEAKPTDRLKGTLQIDLPVGDGVVDVKDAYGEYYLGDAKETRVRFGQAKVPFGFQIPQSSSRRLTMERTDLKVMTPGERDQGAWLMYTPKKLHDRFNELKSHHLGTGDFGFLTAGIFNGQGFNSSEANDSKHFVFRADYPFECGSGRMGQAGVSILTGDYVTGNAEATANSTTATVPAAAIDEHALNFHFYLPPDPWGVQFEYLTGESAALFTPDALDPNTWFVGQADVDAWYGQFHVKAGEDGTAFVRFDEFDGFKKNGLGELPSRNDIERWSFGYAHDIDSKTELTVQFDSLEKNGKDDDFFGVQMQYKY